MSFITIIYNMFDIKYYAMLKAVEENHNTISSYTELRGINNKEDYENLWLNVMYKYDIDVHDYTEIRLYLVAIESYFRDYDISYIKRKEKQYRENQYRIN